MLLHRKTYSSHSCCLWRFGINYIAKASRTSHGGTCLLPQHLAGRGRQIYVGLSATNVVFKVPREARLLVILFCLIWYSKLTEIQILLALESLDFLLIRDLSHESSFHSQLTPGQNVHLEGLQLQIQIEFKPSIWRNNAETELSRVLWSVNMTLRSWGLVLITLFIEWHHSWRLSLVWKIEIGLLTAFECFQEITNTLCFNIKCLCVYSCIELGLSMKYFNNHIHVVHY